MKNKFHVLLAPDSFKGSLRAAEVCAHLKNGVLECDPLIEVTELPLADGGEGTVHALVTAMNGRYVSVVVNDALMRPVQAEYGMVDEGRIAVIEMSAASGLELIDEKDRNPLITSTYGTGELILDALGRGCRRLIIGIGGSATNDGGAGMLEALGAKLISEDGHPIIGGGDLSRITELNLNTLDERLQGTHFQVACDVINPLYGDEGATYVYAAQKGALAKDIHQLEAGVHSWGKLLENVTARSIINTPGSGAAGGLGAGFLALPHAELCSGFEIIQKTVKLEDHIIQADLIITGEGRVDGQSVYGKVVSGVGKLAASHHKPAICLAGTVAEGSQLLLDCGITALFSIVNRPMSLSEAMEQTPELLKESARNVMELVLSSGRNDR